MRISGDQLGMQGFMHKILYQIMHNRIWGDALSNLLVPQVFTCSSHRFSLYLNFFGVKIYPNRPFVPKICPFSIVAKNFNTFPSMLDTLCGDPCSKLQIETPNITDNFLQARNGISFWAWKNGNLKMGTGCTVQANSVRQTTFTFFCSNFSPINIDIMWKHDIFGRGHQWPCYVTHLILHKISQCIEKVGDRRYAL